MLVYDGDNFRAKKGDDGCVPRLRYAHIIRDSRTPLNVLPAKIMQVKL